MNYRFITDVAELKAVAATTALYETCLNLGENNVHELPSSELAIINQLFSTFAALFNNAFSEPTLSYPEARPTATAKAPGKKHRR